MHPFLPTPPTKPSISVSLHHKSNRACPPWISFICPWLQILASLGLSTNVMPWKGILRGMHPGHNHPPNNAMNTSELVTAFTDSHFAGTNLCVFMKCNQGPKHAICSTISNTLLATMNQFKSLKRIKGNQPALMPEIVSKAKASLNPP